jgi:hypothetical protein
MTSFNNSSKITLIAVAAAIAAASNALADSASSGPTRWLDAWRYVARDTPSATGLEAGPISVRGDAAATAPAISVRQIIPGVNCAPETVALAVARPVQFQGCSAPPPRG